MNLLNICENPDILKVLSFGLKLLDIVFIIIPIGLLVMLTIDLLKVVISSDDKTTKQSNKTIMNRIIFAILIFFVPTIVSAVMNLLTDIGVDDSYTVCLNNAKDKEIINQFQIIKDINKEKPNYNKNIASNTENIYKDLATKMIEIANTEIGYKEGTNDDNKYGKALGVNNQPWCSAFVMWVSKQTTINGTNLFNDVLTKEMTITNPFSASNSIHTFKRSNSLDFYYSKYYDGNYTPKKGDLIYFNYSKNWNKEISPNMHFSSGHVGIVEYVENNVVHTIEGNVSGTVGKRNYNLNDQTIAGYGSWYNY